MSNVFMNYMFFLLKFSLSPLLIQFTASRTRMQSAVCAKCLMKSYSTNSSAGVIVFFHPLKHFIGYLLMSNATI